MKFFATCIQGMEEIVKEDLKNQNCKIVDSDITFKQGKVFFESNKKLNEILKLRSVSHIYLLLSKKDVGIKQDAFEKILKNINKTDFLKLFSYIDKKRKKTYRISAKRIGKKQPFTSPEIEKAVAEEIYSKYKPIYDLKNYDYEIYIEVNDNKCIVAGKITKTTLRDRKYLDFFHPALLNSNIAYGLVLLSKPKQDQTVLDPMCGSGTILIERALYPINAKRIVGYDISSKFIKGAKINAKKANVSRKVEFIEGDGTDTRFKEKSVNIIISNLPFGKRVGSAKLNIDLYDRLFKECSRILHHEGKIIFLSTNIRKIKNWYTNKGGGDQDRAY